MSINVSVVIPAFNNKVSILRAVGSALSQLSSTDEVIVVDDGSTDGTLECLRRGVSDPRVRLSVNTRGKGSAGARNVGVLEAQGRFVAFLDADDSWLPGSLEVRLGALVNTGARAVYAPALISTKKGERLAGGRGVATVDAIAVSRVSILTPTVIVERRALLHSGLFNEKMRRSQDIDLFLRLARRSPLAYVDRPAARVDWAAPRIVADAYRESIPHLLQTIAACQLGQKVERRATSIVVLRAAGLLCREGRWGAAVELIAQNRIQGAIVPTFLGCRLLVGGVLRGLTRSSRSAS